MTILSTIVLLGVLIFVHELGHFLAARSVGIRVERFSIGLGPRIAGFTRGDTEYVLSVIPLGGYVKMGGMDDEVMEAIEGGRKGKAARERDPNVAAVQEDTDGSSEGERDPDGFDSKPVWARAWVISAGVIMNFAFAFLTYTVVAAGWGFPEMETTRLGVLDAEAVPTEASGLLRIPAGASIVQIGDRTVSHWGEVREAIVDGRGGPTSIVFERPAGEVQIDLTGSELREQVFDAMDYWLDPVIDMVSPDTPAERAGLESGDRVVAVDDLEIRTWPQLVSAVRSSAEVEIELTLERDGGRLTTPVTPMTQQEPDPETGETVTFGQIGVSAALPNVAFSPMPPFQAVSVGWDDTVFITGRIFGILRDLLTRAGLGSERG